MNRDNQDVSTHACAQRHATPPSHFPFAQPPHGHGVTALSLVLSHINMTTKNNSTGDADFRPGSRGIMGAVVPLAQSPSRGGEASLKIQLPSRPSLPSNLNKWEELKSAHKSHSSPMYRPRFKDKNGSRAPNKGETREARGTRNDALFVLFFAFVVCARRQGVLAAEGAARRGWAGEGRAAVGERGCCPDA